MVVWHKNNRKSIGSSAVAMVGDGFRLRGKAGLVLSC